MILQEDRGGRGGGRAGALGFVQVVRHQRAVFFGEGGVEADMTSNVIVG